jgi:sialate O-acetylesterase
MKRILIPLLTLLITFSALAAEKIKVACVGNSVTYGYGIDDRDTNSYPAQLQRLLGDNYDVRNFGHSGATLLKNGHRPYTSLEEYPQAIDFAADYVIIHLGLNDTDPRDWPNYGYQFISDYVELIDSFRQARPDCKVMICLMSPIFHTHSRFKSGTRDWFWLIQDNIAKIADITGATLLDFHKDLYQRPDLMPDALHPNAEGASFLAKTVYGAVSGDFGGLKVAPIYTDGMVLQRERPLVIHGTANAGDKVVVTFGSKKAKATASVADGSWSVTLPAMQANAKPQKLTISTKDSQLIFSDVLVGDVWLCSGQSNMEFRVNESVNSEQKAEKEYAETAPNIRLFDMKARWLTYNSVWPETMLDSLRQRNYYKETSWQHATPETVARFSAIGFSFGRELADSLNVPIGLICNAVGGSNTESWVDRKTLEFEFPDILYNFSKNDFIQPWVRERAAYNVSASGNANHVHPYTPAYLFEAGIQPLDHFAIKGTIWYQGESNAHNIEAHERLFGLLLNSWRNYWNDEDMPFIFVQLSGINRPSWPQFRDSQRQLADKLSNCYMAVSFDKGDSTNVHPRRKLAIGQRVARQALNHVYGRTDIVPAGPVPSKAQRKGSAVYLSFDNGQGLHASTGDKIITFEVAEQPGLYRAATAEVTADGRLKVSAPDVKSPRYVRYGWQPFSRANLVNALGLPCSTFELTVD